MISRLTLLALLLILPVTSLAATAVVIEQPERPLQIHLYENEYDETDGKQFVVHEVKYQNTSDQEILAIRFGLLELNPFDDLIGAFYGYITEETDAGDKESTEFLNENAKAPFFEDRGTGLLWVDAIRFADGSFWRADRTTVLSELQKQLPSLEAADLDEKRSLIDN
ncbi:MAG: hypothetical protein C0621_07030 [Desulfuromonas sp.]|nr:MAG: hypothetical protein C0621_07030 [Desulfuromonas sp.]